MTSPSSPEEREALSRLKRLRDDAEASVSGREITRQPIVSNWFVETRLAWIRESVEIFGRINRGHIQAKFGISSAQASLDLRAALERWPDLMSYDRSVKQYVSTDETQLVHVKEKS